MGFANRRQQSVRSPQLPFTLPVKFFSQPLGAWGLLVPGANYASAGRCLDSNARTQTHASEPRQTSSLAAIVWADAAPKAVRLAPYADIAIHCSCR